MKDSGQYVCFRDGGCEAVHHLEVVDNEPVRQVSTGYCTD